MTITVTIPDADLEDCSRHYKWTDTSPKTKEQYLKDQISTLIRDAIKAQRKLAAADAAAKTENDKADSVVTVS